MIDVNYENLPILVLTIATGILGVARLVRVITFDRFPPAVWWREFWTDLVRDTEWRLLFTCFWCLPFWVVLACVGWHIGGWYVEWLAWAWWIFWGSLAAAYVVSMVIVRDGGED